MLSSLVLLVTTVVGCGLLPYTMEGDAPAFAGQDVRITLIHTSDIHSRILPYDFDPSYTDNTLGLSDDVGPYGGIGQIAWLVERERKKASRALWVDTGDLFQGAIVFNEFHGEAEVRTVSEAGLDVMVLGNHDYDDGAQNLSNQLNAWATFDSLAANYDFEDDAFWVSDMAEIARPSVIKDLDGFKVGFIGLANLSSLYSIWDQSNSLDVRALHTGDVIPWEAAKLRAQGAQLIVVLSHLGLDDDLAVARTFSDIDLILGGHHHVAINPPLVVTNEVTGKLIPVVHSGAFSKFVGRLDLVVRDGKLVSHDYALFPVDSAVPVSPHVQEVLEEYSDILEQKYNLDQVLGVAETDLTRYGTTGGDSMLGNFAADAIRFYQGVETEIALSNTLGIRADISPGDITLDDVYNSFPFDNTITTMYLTGREVQELLDYVSSRSSERGCNSQGQVSGISFVMNCTDGIAEDILINGAPLDPDNTYELATNNYIAAGGSGFEVLERNTTQSGTSISIRDVVAAAIRSYRTLPQPGVCEEEERIIPYTY